MDDGVAAAVAVAVNAAALALSADRESPGECRPNIALL